MLGSYYDVLKYIDTFVLISHVRILEKFGCSRLSESGFDTTLNDSNAVHQKKYFYRSVQVNYIKYKRTLDRYSQSLNSFARKSGLYHY